MARAFTMEVGASDLRQRALSKIIAALRSWDEDQFRGTEDEVLTDQLVQSWVVEPLEWDHEREASLGMYEDESTPGRRTYGTLLVLDLPLVPKSSNVDVLAVRPMKRINDDIDECFRDFRSTVQRMVTGRRHELEREHEMFARAAREVGVELRRKPDAISPVEVRERKAVLELRDQSRRRTGPRDPHLTPEATQKIHRPDRPGGQGVRGGPPGVLQAG
jgi:hypothetical protein